MSFTRFLKLTDDIRSVKRPTKCIQYRKLGVMLGLHTKYGKEYISLTPNLFYSSNSLRFDNHLHREPETWTIKTEISDTLRIEYY